MTARKTRGEIDLLTRDNLTELAEHCGPAHLSLFMPTHRAGPDTRQDPIRFRNLIRRAAELLAEQGGMHARESDELLAPAHELASPSAWCTRSRGLRRGVPRRRRGAGRRVPRREWARRRRRGARRRRHRLGVGPRPPHLGGQRPPPGAAGGRRAGSQFRNRARPGRRPTSGRDLGFLGEKGVNVLELNLALDEADS